MALPAPPALDTTAAPAAAPGGWRGRVRVLAWASVALSFPVWGAAFVVVPFLPIGLGAKAAAAGGCIAAGEVMFWGAGVIIGADRMAALKARLPRWRRARGGPG
jgi:hypothetical protein